MDLKIRCRLQLAVDFGGGGFVNSAVDSAVDFAFGGGLKNPLLKTAVGDPLGMESFTTLGLGWPHQEESHKISRGRSTGSSGRLWKQPTC